MKTIKKINFRVEVYPKTTLYGVKVDEEEDVCQAMLADIKRHVNDVKWANVVSDNNPVCTFCGSRWTEDGDSYNGGCCKADQDAEDARAVVHDVGCAIVLNGRHACSCKSNDKAHFSEVSDSERRIK